MFHCLRIALVLLLYTTACNQAPAPASDEAKNNPVPEKAYVSAVLDSFHVAAAEANFDWYFAYFTSDGTFLGTDATEHWTKDQFMVWAKPHFDKKKTWNFTSMQRHVYLNEQANMAWFDELLKTQMKICRGSGVLKKENGNWKICQYVLSMTFPNEQVKEVVALKSSLEDSLMLTLQTEKQ